MLIAEMQERAGEQQQASERNPLPPHEKKRHYGKKTKARRDQNHGTLVQVVKVQTTAHALTM